MVKLDKDKKIRKMVDDIKAGKLSIREAMSTFPEPDICIIEDKEESEEE
ncbi:hypothetical protein LCGC14_0619020 [marine sediment metagenome]|uniref:Uncharacterized protein n=1 Tax=marine sediment metagenome TaxID=412755 RepID=A0A0F9RPR9_9ZZZZ